MIWVMSATPRPLPLSATRIEQALRRSEHGLTMRGLVAATGLHENAVRRTVARLVQRGIVHAQPDRRPSRGRPTLRYRHAGGPEEPFQRFLPLLLRLIDQAAVSQQDAYNIGRAQGLSAVGESRASAGEAVTRSLASLGFAPLERGSTEAGAAVLALSRCPFSDAVTSPAAGRRVCDLHHGLVAGIAEAHGGEVASFTVNDPRNAACEVAVQGGRAVHDDPPAIAPTIAGPKAKHTAT
jgi:predicted ArsR family transcriptional regulator